MLIINGILAAGFIFAVSQMPSATKVGKIVLSGLIFGNISSFFFLNGGSLPVSLAVGAAFGSIALLAALFLGSKQDQTVNTSQGDVASVPSTLKMATASVAATTAALLAGYSGSQISQATLAKIQNAPAVVQQNPANLATQAFIAPGSNGQPDQVAIVTPDSNGNYAVSRVSLNPKTYMISPTDPTQTEPFYTLTSNHNVQYNSQNHFQEMTALVATANVKQLSPASQETALNLAAATGHDVTVLH